MLSILKQFITVVLASGEVVKLTTETFDSFIKENPLSLVKFYAPWCGHCKTLAPHYEAASEKIPENVKLAEVDVTEEEAIGSLYEIRGFPTMKFFREGIPEEYTGGRTAETIVEWIALMTSDPVTSVESPEKAREQFPSENVIMGVFAKDSPEAETFQKIAEGNRLLGRFCSMEGEPSVAMYRSGETEGVTTTFGDSMDAVVDFLRLERLPYFGTVNGDTFGSYVETGLDFIWFAGSEEDRAKVEDELTTVGKEFRGKYNIVSLDTEQFARQAEGMLGVSEYPTIVRTEDSPGRYIYPHTEFTADLVRQFIKDMEDGIITVQLKSEAVPETNDEAVKVVVGTQFEEIVAADKDVLLEIYAPWCGHCKKLAPIYDTIGEKVAKISDKIVIAKIDGTANEIGVEGYEFQGFPTIYYKKAGEAPAPYTGGRELADIMAFLSENATTPFEYTHEEETVDHDEL